MIFIAAEPINAVLGMIFRISAVSLQICDCLLRTFESICFLNHEGILVFRRQQPCAFWPVINFTAERLIAADHVPQCQLRIIFKNLFFREVTSPNCSAIWMRLLCARDTCASRTSGMYLFIHPILLSQHEGGRHSHGRYSFDRITCLPDQPFSKCWLRH